MGGRECVYGRGGVYRGVHAAGGRAHCWEELGAVSPASVTPVLWLLQDSGLSLSCPPHPRPTAAACVSAPSSFRLCCSLQWPHGVC